MKNRASVLTTLLVTSCLLSISAIGLIGYQVAVAPKEPEKLTIDEGIRDKIEKNTVSIISVGAGFGRCSGVVLKETEDKSYIVTAKHCIGIAEETYVEDKRVEFIATAAEDDLAYLIVNGILENKESVTIAKEDVKLDDIVYHVAYPTWDEKLYESAGKVTRKSDDWTWATLESRGGCSGGGIFNENGEYIGVLWGGLRYEPVTFFEPLKDTKQFLNQVNEYIK